MYLKIVLLNYVVLISAMEEKEKQVMNLLVNRPTIPRIIGGKPLKKGEFPWMVSLQYDKQHFCGATIIDYEWVITAAHCVADGSPQPFEVVCGAYSLSKPTDEQRVSPQKVIVHEKWNSTIISDDIAVIKLQNKFYKTTNCKTINLPDDNLVLDSGLESIATGWGRTSNLNDKVSDIPQKVSLPLLSQKECNDKYSKINTTILGTNLCAGGHWGKGICNGDSGGPLNCMLNNSWTFVGLDSFTVPCARIGFPSVFTKISEYNPWIRQNMV